ncbi:MAG TPA: ATP-dependent protease ATPase subunit HslU [Candidatus Fimimonas merdipullorum]|uniref:ATP-dependent protease ATPase subunit HslU n=1 Tax=Candidatus Fimimonas merdipullorum TaxID=2840822 RepID=A0A9D1MW75_9BACT|nr:ATP-dependent protease ATPase subunit HslU [Candidatus Fimimonas merdipullorum]
MTPKQIVSELDRYIVGQFEAKKAVAIALRNRYRRSKLSLQDREEITPKNIIMKGPTGVGKTEIARRLAKIVKAPFLKVEATKYTEVGYVGRDVESMIRDLVEVAIRLVKDERYKEVESRAFAAAVNRVADLLSKKSEELPQGVTKATLVDELSKHNLDQLNVEIQVADVPKPIELQAGGGGGEINLGSIFGDILPKKMKKRTVTVEEALKIFAAEESEKLIDLDSVEAEALRRAENDGVIFIDEMDKIAGAASHNGPDVSREGVQRDILPIVEGCTVSTKYGNVKTDYILFIASGAFHVSKVSDLIPELQGRFPVLVELASLGVEDFVKILTVPANAITDQYKKLLAVDGIDLQFTDDGIREIANVAFDQNNTLEDIGARRLQSIMEHIVEDVSYDVNEGESRTVVIDQKYVENNFRTESRNLKKYVL